MTGRERKARIEAQLGGIVSGETQGAIGGGQFTYDPDKLRQIIKNWRDLARSYDESLKNALRMMQILPPAEDIASEAFISQANESGRSYLTYLGHNRDCCLEQAQLCQNALDDYLGIEERTVIAVNDAADGGPQPGL